MAVLVLIGIVLLLCVFLLIFGAGQNRDWDMENREQTAALKEDKK